MLIKFLLIATLSLTQVFAKDLVSGEARFYAEDEDTLGFVKSQLIYLATKDVLTKEMVALDMDAEAFWVKYQNAFEESFLPVQKNLEAVYKVGDPKQTWEQKTKFKQLMREKRLKALGNFGGLSKVIQAYSIKKMSRSPQYPKSRFLMMSAKVDRRALNRLYYHFMVDSDAKGLQKVYLSPHFHINYGEWKHLGVDYEQELSEVVAKHWKDWLQKKMNLESDQIEITGTVLEKKIDHHVHATDFALENAVQVQTQNDENHDFKNSVWIKINVDINWHEDNSLVKKRSFDFKCGLMAINLSNRRSVFYDEITTPIQTYFFNDQHKLSSEVASYIYRLPLSKFEPMQRLLKSLNHNTRFRSLLVQNAQNMADYFSLQEYLQKAGAKFGISAQVRSYEVGEGRLLLEFRGHAEEIQKWLRDLSGQKLSNGKKMSFPDKNNPYLIKLNSEA